MRVSQFIRVGLISGALNVGAISLIGCAPERHEAIPASANQVAEGGHQLSYTAPHDGMVYLYDHNDGKLLYSGIMKKGQKFEIDAGMPNRVTLDGKVLQDKTLTGGHDYRLFFDDTASNGGM